MAGGGLELRYRGKREKGATADPTSATVKVSERVGVPSIKDGSYWLTRVVFVRALGFVYFVAFLVALNQNKALLGNRGLLPVPIYLRRLRAHYLVPANASTTWEAFKGAPTLFWWVTERHTDLALDVVACTGLALSGVLVVLGAGNALIFAVMWVLYHSLVNVGQQWYSFGWESQLLETGFLAIFLCPVLNMRQFPSHTLTPWVVLWAYRWLLFRIMLGAGLIKIRGDQCWRDLTCMNHHYETQPVPNPLSYYLHQMPELIHSAETMANHIVELVVPFLMFLPRPFKVVCGVLQILFQVALILSGNLSFLNWLTILPALFCFDDKFLAPLFSERTRRLVVALQGAVVCDEHEDCSMHEGAGGTPSSNTASPPGGTPSSNTASPPGGTPSSNTASPPGGTPSSNTPGGTPSSNTASPPSDAAAASAGRYIRQVSNVVLALLLAYLSIPVVQNLLSHHQVMNTSFNSLRLVNTYGAFGSITKDRTEVVFEGTFNSTVGTNEELVHWQEIEFNCKPGRTTQRPCFISPYHYRIDWLLWFAAFQDYQHNPWLVHFVGKLLVGDPLVNDLVVYNPFRDSPPKYVRVLHYRYRYTPLGTVKAEQGHWWERSLVSHYLPAVSAKQLKPVMEAQGWAS